MSCLLPCPWHRPCICPCLSMSMSMTMSMSTSVSMFISLLNSMSMLHVYIHKAFQCPFWRFMSMSTPRFHVNAVCSCWCFLSFCISIFMLHVHVSILHVHVSMLHVHVSMLHFMSMLHVNAACLQCMSMLPIRAACLCCMSMLHIHATCPCCMFMMHVHAHVRERPLKQVSKRSSILIRKCYLKRSFTTYLFQYPCLHGACLCMLHEHDVWTCCTKMLHPCCVNIQYCMKRT